MTIKLTGEQIEALREIEEGATIYDLFLAKTLREIQKVDRELLTIIEDMDELGKITGITYNGAEQLPYFGAILTEKGRGVLNG